MPADFFVQILRELLPAQEHTQATENRRQHVSPS
jgi:hypothetical protein